MSIVASREDSQPEENAEWNFLDSSKKAEQNWPSQRELVPRKWDFGVSC
jgi:hypothetical protein